MIIMRFCSGVSFGYSVEKTLDATSGIEALAVYMTSLKALIDKRTAQAIWTAIPSEGNFIAL